MVAQIRARPGPGGVVTISPTGAVRSARNRSVSRLGAYVGSTSRVPGGVAPARARASSSRSPPPENRVTHSARRRRDRPPPPPLRGPSGVAAGRVRSRSARSDSGRSRRTRSVPATCSSGWSPRSSGSSSVPSPDRSTRPTVDVTPPPSPTTRPHRRHPARARRRRRRRASGPRRRRRSSTTRRPSSPTRLRKDWCAPAGVQMTLAASARPTRPRRSSASSPRGSTSGRAYADSHNGEWGPAAMALALEAYGAPGYEIRAYQLARRRRPRRGDRDHDDPVAGDPPRLEGRPHLGHDRLPRRRRPDGLPGRGDDRAPTSSIPWYPWNSSIWGQSDPPGHVPGLARDGAQLPALEAARGQVPGPRREVHHPRPDDPGQRVSPSLTPRRPRVRAGPAIRRIAERQGDRQDRDLDALPSA